MTDTISHFNDAIRATGMEPPCFIEPGKFYRFSGVGKRQKNRAGWCLLFDDELSGCFGDWSSGSFDTWHAKPDKPYTRIERSNFTKRVVSAKQKAELEREVRQAEAKKKATAIWYRAVAAPGNHPYLLCKGIRPKAARIFHEALTLPITDFNGRLTSLQFITSDGSKRFLSGGRKQGCFIHVAGILENPSSVIICEGWATGCTLSDFEPAALILAAIDAGNLEAVAITARRCWPSAELIIAGDDDRLTKGNPGATKAHAAAIASNAQLALPEWPQNAPEHLTDFNDLAMWLEGGVE